jgi:hypothetical protein
MQFVRAVQVEVYSPFSGKEYAIAFIRSLDGSSTEVQEFKSNHNATDEAWWWIKERCEQEAYQVFELKRMRFDDDAQLVVDED